MNKEQLLTEMRYLTGAWARGADYDDYSMDWEVVFDHLDFLFDNQREKCAQIADEMTQHTYLGSVGKAIRAKGQA